MANDDPWTRATLVVGAAQSWQEAQNARDNARKYYNQVFWLPCECRRSAPLCGACRKRQQATDLMDEANKAQRDAGVDLAQALKKWAVG